MPTIEERCWSTHPSCSRSVNASSWAMSVAFRSIVPRPQMNLQDNAYDCKVFQELAARWILEMHGTDYDMYLSYPKCPWHRVGCY